MATDARQPSFLHFGSSKPMGRAKRPSFSLVEFLIAVLILGELTSMAIPKIAGSAQPAKVKTCKNNIQNNHVELLYMNTGSWSSNSKKVTKDTNYFPDGEPICPMTGTTYPNELFGTNKVDASGHNH